jgi:hypothetical protein
MSAENVHIEVLTEKPNVNISMSIYMNFQEFTSSYETKNDKKKLK